jgi:hypothetical protein
MRPCTVTYQHGDEDVVLDRHLQCPRRPGGPEATAADGVQVGLGDVAAAELHSEEVRGGHGILDREVDADAADAEEPRLRPAREAIDAHAR